MPGIIGLITRMPREHAVAELSRMVEALRHESFYKTGTLIDEPLGVYCGWVAQKNSFADGMPLSNERADISLIFSGEEYPEPGTAQRLRERGHGLDPQGPSYLVHSYEEDPNFLAGLNGMFHGLLIDRTRGTAMLFSDRYGMHHLCYHQSTDAFYFAAEAKAILAVRPELRTPDPRSLGEFVACGSVLQNRTIFKRIETLPGGSAWVFRAGRLEKKTSYFHPAEWENQDPLEPEAYYRELRDALSRNLPRYFNGGQPIGMTLTGGLDTRVIMAWRKPAPGTLPCYTFGGMFRDCEDVRVARKVAGLCGQSHEVLTVGEEFLARFARYAERSTYLSEGGVDVSRTSDLYVSEKAREVAPVKVVGTYGSEIIQQAVIFKPTMPMPDLYRPEFLSYVSQAAGTYAGIRKEHPVTFAAFRQSPWHHHPILALEQSQLSVRSPFLDNDFVRTVFRAPNSNGPNGDVRLRLVRDGNPALAAFPTDHGVGGSSASRAFLEFTSKAEYAYDYGMPQWIARVDHLLSPFHVERLFLGRHKLLHFRIWYRDALSDYVRQMLLDPLTLSRPYLDRTGVEAVVQGHLRGDRNYTTEIHKLLTLELVHRLFFDPR
jgi:asparagine synthase (glutamine-hydrolysing)